MAEQEVYFPLCIKMITLAERFIRNYIMLQPLATAVLRAHIIKLLKAELKSHKLTTGLSQLGIQVEAYHADLGSVILDLMGFTAKEREENVYAYYDASIEKLMALETATFHKELETLAQSLYEELRKRKN